MEIILIEYRIESSLKPNSLLWLIPNVLVAVVVVVVYTDLQ